MKYYIDKFTNELYAYEDDADAELDEEGNPRWRKPGLIPCELRPDQYHTWEAATKKWVMTGATQKSSDEQDALTAAVQSHLDSTAQAKGYDNMISACSYGAAPNPYQAESIAYLEWRAAVWVHCHQVLTAVQAGTRAIPTVAEMIAELPALVLPA